MELLLVAGILGVDIDLGRAGPIIVALIAAAAAIYSAKNTTRATVAIERDKLDRTRVKDEVEEARRACEQCKAELQDEVEEKTTLRRELSVCYTTIGRLEQQNSHLIQQVISLGGTP